MATGGADSLLVVQSACVGSLFLPFGGVTSAVSGILGYKISMAGSLLSMLSQGFTGHDVTTTTTTEKTEIKVPISALQNVLNMNEEQKLQIDLLFAFLKEIDDRGCVSRMVCESAADALRLGKVGTATKYFFDTNAGVGTKAVSVFRRCREDWPIARPRRVCAGLPRVYRQPPSRPHRSRTDVVHDS
ncbi:hypothetical protein HPB51_028138 [Rhipicephalus microplus]|uniref:Uncharacterized protein n=1 Tax=Rhipicephalus microplus TaxID=6941 RepID=A0A9J6CY34_RHIMP|nr:hypothetical protein HPB51_028138 [Rhipicephalus microplus]